MLSLLLVAAHVAAVTAQAAWLRHLPTFQGIRRTKTFSGIVPIEYTVDLRIDPGLQTFTGGVKITFETRNARVPYIFLNWGDLELPNISDNIQLRDRRKAGVGLRSGRPLFHSGAQTIAIRPASPLKSNHRYHIHIKQYSGEIKPGRSFGIYRGLALSPSTYAVATQFQLNHARDAFPCMDQPMFKAPFTLRLTHPRDAIALSNTLHTSAVPVGSSELSTTFGVTPPLPTYTFAFALLPKTAYTQLPPARSGAGTPLTLHFNPRSVSLSLAKELMGYAKTSMNALEKYFYANPIPQLQKVDFVMMPEFYLQGMENFGMITLNQDYLVRTRPALRLSLLAHELAHMWFSNYATIETWDQLCLQEGLTDHFARTIVREHFGAESEEFMSYMLEKYLHSMNVESTSRRGAEDSMILSSNPTISQVSRKCFGKSVFIVDSLEALVGTRQFQDKMNSFLFRHKNAGFNLADFKDAFTDVVLDGRKQLASEFYGFWFTNGGYPIVTAERNYNADSIRLSQQQFWFGERRIDLQVQWPIPLRGKVESRSWDMNVELFNTSTALVPARGLGRDAWYMLNPGVGHFYRVNYDGENWELLLEALRSRPESLAKLSRAQLLADLCFFLDQGLIRERVAQLKATLSSLLRHHRDSFPRPEWYTTKCG